MLFLLPLIGSSKVAESGFFVKATWNKMPCSQCNLTTGKPEKISDRTNENIISPEKPVDCRGKLQS